ncbi:MAG: hypothetical protein F9K29_20075 [Hyphomicrobiaceae bacterium]|nr:MAG: hypothetical protein F9K29_20075 [Hyphomicrobiaceae bacterium]
MSTLAYSGHDLVADAAAPEKSARKSLWRIAYEALVASRQRRAEREIAAYLESHGGLLTDEMEREIMRRMSPTRL